MITETRTVVKIKSNDLSGNAVLSLRAEKTVENVILTVKESSEKEFKFVYSVKGKSAEYGFCVDKPILWTLTSPFLYGFNLDILFGDGQRENVSGRFGFRNISENGKEILLNGKPLFIRGFIRGAAAHEHSDNCGLSEKEFYRKNVRAAKKYGFNFVRFHSVVPDDTFFDVADEEGMLVHIEMRLPDDIYDNLREMPESGGIFVSDEYVAYITEKFYNHPSLCVYCIGNEIKDAGAVGRIREIHDLIESADDTRLFLDTCAWGENNRPYVDLDVQHMSYYFPFNAHADMFENADNLLVVGSNGNRPLKSEGENSVITRDLFFKVPLIAHEVCHYTALRDYAALDEKFKKYGKEKPWWIDEEIKMIRDKGYEKIYPEMYRASKYFQFECWKTAFEAMRKSRLLGGFHFLQFADTDLYENSNGIVDCFDDENAVSPKDFIRFNGDRVITTDLSGRIFAAESEISFRVDLSDCGEGDEQFADVIYFLEGKGGKVYARGTLKNADVSRKGVYGLCKIRLRLPPVVSSEEAILKIRLENDGKVYAENSWKIWIYDVKEKTSYSQFLEYADGGVYVTDDFEKTFSLLENGNKVCLVYRSDFTRHVAHKKMQNPEYAFKASWNRFKPVIWDRGTNYGGLCDEKILNKYGFASGRYYDFNMSVLSEDCDKINLDDFPVKVNSIISGTDKSTRDRFDAYKDCFNLPDLLYDRTLRNFSYLFGVGAGKGKLLVCGLNMTGLDRGEPSTLCMANFIIGYMKSEDFNPEHRIELDELKNYLKICAEKPIKESIMTQFWTLDDAPVESKTFWKESREYLETDKTQSD